MPAEPLSVVLSCLEPHICGCAVDSCFEGPEHPIDAIATSEIAAAATPDGAPAPLPPSLAALDLRLRVATIRTAAASDIAPDAMSPRRA